MKYSIFFISCIFTLSGCTFNNQSNSKNKPENLLFQNNNLKSFTLNVKRDTRLCSAEENEKDCPIEFYIDGFKSGVFQINNEAKYYLNANKYTLYTKNCDEDCKTSKLLICVTNEHKNAEIILTINNQNQPTILIPNTHSTIICPEQKLSDDNKILQHEKIELNTDTLFKFDGYTLNDLLPEGQKSLNDLVSKIDNYQVQIDNIVLTGHTDRLGTEAYNQQLGYNRARTIQEYLINANVPVREISFRSAGKSSPKTDGCFNEPNREKLHACLQPDRRVEVEITGINQR